MLARATTSSCSPPAHPVRFRTAPAARPTALSYSSSSAISPAPALRDMHVDPYIVLGSAVIGLLVGMTGAGGGALMTPMLILLFGVTPSSAISSDLVAAVLMRPLGAAVHMRARTVNFRLVRWMVAGSVPAAFLGAFLLHEMGNAELRAEEHRDRARRRAADRRRRDGAALRPRPPRGAHAHGGRPRDRRRGRCRRSRSAWSAGIIVGMTSVGSGSLMIVLLLFLYPTIGASQLVGTDLTQAVPLTAAAALGQLAFGHVEFGVTASLVIGSVPGRARRIAALLQRSRPLRPPGDRVRDLRVGPEVRGPRHDALGWTLCGVLLACGGAWLAIAKPWEARAGRIEADEPRSRTDRRRPCSQPQTACTHAVPSQTRDLIALPHDADDAHQSPAVCRRRTRRRGAAAGRNGARRARRQRRSDARRAGRSGLSRGRPCLCAPPDRLRAARRSTSTPTPSARGTCRGGRADDARLALANEQAPLHLPRRRADPCRRDAADVGRHRLHLPRRVVLHGEVHRCGSASTLEQLMLASCLGAAGGVTTPALAAALAQIAANEAQHLSVLAGRAGEATFQDAFPAPLDDRGGLECARRVHELAPGADARSRRGRVARGGGRARRRVGTARGRQRHRHHRLRRGVADQRLPGDRRRTEVLVRRLEHARRADHARRPGRRVRLGEHLDPRGALREGTRREARQLHPQHARDRRAEVEPGRDRIDLRPDEARRHASTSPTRASRSAPTRSRSSGR